MQPFRVRTPREQIVIFYSSGKTNRSKEYVSQEISAKILAQIIGFILIANDMKKNKWNNFSIIHIIFSHVIK